MPLEVRSYLQNSFQEIIRDENFLNALPGLLPHGSAGRERIVEFRMKQLSQIPLVESFSGHVMVSCATEPLSIEVISMTGTSQRLAPRNFDTASEFLSCLSELGISLDYNHLNPDAYNKVYAIEGIPLQMFAKWNLVSPID